MYTPTCLWENKTNAHSGQATVFFPLCLRQVCSIKWHYVWRKNKKTVLNTTHDIIISIIILSARQNTDSDTCPYRLCYTWGLSAQGTYHTLNVKFTVQFKVWSVLHPICQKFFHLADDGPFRAFSFFKRRSLTTSSPRLSPPNDWFCDVLGFVLAARQCLKLLNISDLRHKPLMMVALPAGLQHVQGGTSTGTFGGGCWTLAHVCQSGLSTPFSVASSLNLWGRYHVCSVTSWSPAAEARGNCFRYRCQAGDWDCIGSTVFMSHLAWQWSPTLGDWIISVH